MLLYFLKPNFRMIWRLPNARLCNSTKPAVISSSSHYTLCDSVETYHFCKELLWQTELLSRAEQGWAAQSGDEGTGLGAWGPPFLISALWLTSRVTLDEVLPYLWFPFCPLPVSIIEAVSHVRQGAFAAAALRWPVNPPVLADTRGIAIMQTKGRHFYIQRVTWH